MPSDLWSEAKRGTQKSGVETLSAKDKSHILLAVLLIGMVFIGVIIAGAYAASINYQNNQIRESNQALQSEVQSLHIDLESASNLANIEKRATKDLGMVYPDGDKHGQGDLRLLAHALAHLLQLHVLRKTEEGHRHG